MIEEKMKLSLYNVVELTTFDKRTYTGWLIPGCKNNEYMILPLKDTYSVYVFKKSHIQSLKYINSGVVIR